jgi:dipeptidyl aminopeptidase/acylaminoacyl peptidase
MRQGRAITDGESSRADSLTSARRPGDIVRPVRTGTPAVAAFCYQPTLIASGGGEPGDGLREFYRLPGSVITTVRWSPDGRELLLESAPTSIGNTCNSNLRRYPLDANYEPQPVFGTSSPFQSCWEYGMKGQTWPDWSPDGTRIVAQSTFDPSLYVVTISDLEPRQFLTRGRQPAWSPDGTAIVYAAFDEDLQHTTLHLIDPDGQNDRPLTAPPPAERDRNPAWSPDGATVAFVRRAYSPDNTVLSVAAYLVDPDGSNERRLAELSLDDIDAHPSWSHDGLHVAYAGSGGTYVGDADGTGFHQISEAPAHTPAAWRP